MSGQSLFSKRSLVRLSCPSASQVPRRRAVDGYINNLDSNMPIITNHTPRDWSLIAGRVQGGGGRGLQNGKIAGPKLLDPPPSRQGRTLCAPPPFKGWKLFAPPHITIAKTSSFKDRVYRFGCEARNRCNAP